MKIQVDREVTLEGDLKFTVTVKDPHSLVKSTEILNFIDYSTRFVEDLHPTFLKLDTLKFYHDFKEKIFLRMIESLKFSIKNELEIKFNPMCQEIYNWIYDYQEKPIRDWLSDFDPVRTKYYFDNDKKFDYTYPKDEISQDKIDEDEDENETEF